MSAWPPDGPYFLERRAELLEDRRRRLRRDSRQVRETYEEILGKVILAERRIAAANRLARVLGGLVWEGDPHGR